MAMVNVVYWLPMYTDRFLAQVDWLGPKVGRRRSCFCIHCVNQRFEQDDSTIRINVVIIIIIFFCPR